MGPKQKNYLWHSAQSLSLSLTQAHTCETQTFQCRTHAMGPSNYCHLLHKWYSAKTTQSGPNPSFLYKIGRTTTHSLPFSQSFGTRSWRLSHVRRQGLCDRKRHCLKMYFMILCLFLGAKVGAKVGQNPFSPSLNPFRDFRKNPPFYPV